MAVALVVGRMVVALEVEGMAVVLEVEGTVIVTIEVEGMAIALPVEGQSAVGIGELTASQAFGYVQPCTAVGAKPVSDESNQPSPVLTDGEGLGDKVGGGRVGTALVDV